MIEFIPPKYNPEDASRARFLMDQIDAILRQAREKCEPFVDELCAIESRYMPKMIVPKQDALADAASHFSDDSYIDYGGVSVDLERG